MADGLHINGLAELMKKMGVAGQVIHSTLFQASDRATKYVHSQVPGYPPKPAGSRYRRTEMLGRSTHTEVRPLGGNGFVGIIGNKMKYAPWVISSESVGNRGPQASVHKGRWWTLQGVVTQSASEVYRIFHQAVLDILRQL